MVAGLAVLMVAAATVVFLSLNRVDRDPAAGNEAQPQEQTASTPAGPDAAIAAAPDAGQVKLTWPQEHPLRLFFSGDSLTAGEFSTTEDTSFRRLVTAGLGKRGAVEEVGTYKSGYRLQDVASGFAIPRGAGLAVVELGTNDLVTNTDTAVFARQYKEYLNRVAAASPDAKLLCLGVWAPAAAGRTAALDAAITAGCHAHGGQFISLKELFGTPANRGPAGDPVWLGSRDSFHPNDAGHAAIADAVLQRIAPS
ncbi:SGNH/GDSL hydrolase family protein [Arthrobacter sp. FW306-06-A]|uniref:SGNH/GDSL hydrolase family protein n=1 Tax=Arthrobacter sp. FW306-06-A TaxID=2879621 RepID=UPI001F300694|nr:SGNH/GDSL hydrolase family protein [Arthrobacter sp. FW306-06-A]UKA70264.1 SGNH/GDSL hydrolase family protein [Arthrobacter sp. FW306-06-A]